MIETEACLSYLRETYDTGREIDGSISLWRDAIGATIDMVQEIWVSNARRSFASWRDVIARMPETQWSSVSPKQARTESQHRPREGDCVMLGRCGLALCLSDLNDKTIAVRIKQRRAMLLARILRVGQLAAGRSERAGALCLLFFLVGMRWVLRARRGDDAGWGVERRRRRCYSFHWPASPLLDRWDG